MRWDGVLGPEGVKGNRPAGEDKWGGVGRLGVAESRVHRAFVVAESSVRGAMAPAAADGAVDCLGRAWCCAPHAARARPHPTSPQPLGEVFEFSTSRLQDPGALLDGQGHKGPSLGCYWFTSIRSSLFASWQPRPGASGPPACPGLALRPAAWDLGLGPGAWGCGLGPRLGGSRWAAAAGGVPARAAARAAGRPGARPHGPSPVRTAWNTRGEAKPRVAQALDCPGAQVCGDVALRGQGRVSPPTHARISWPEWAGGHSCGAPDRRSRSRRPS